MSRLAIAALLVFATNALAGDVPFAPASALSTRSYFHVPADIDQDGDVDLFVTRAFGWLENSAGDASSWTEHTIPLEFGAISHFAAADFDNDGDLDLVAVREDDLFGDSIPLFEQTSPQVWTTTSGLGGPFAETLRAADMDGDGDADLLVSRASSSRIVWYENRSSGQGFSWVTHEVVTTRSAIVAVPADLDGDGDIDVLSSGFDDDIVWFESDGADPPTYTERTIPTTYTGSPRVEAADVDGDLDIDVFVASLDTVYWHENDGADPPGWSEHLVTGSADDPRVLLPVDLDHDGDHDLVTGGFGDLTVRWHENAAGDGSNWVDRTLGVGLKARAISAIDLDGRGDTDLVVSTWLGGGPLSWLENLTPPAGGVPDGASIVGIPLTLEPASGDRLTLSWSASCLGDEDYAIYEGPIGAYDEHQPIDCSTSGSTSATIRPDDGDRYYLVVPRGELSEGSYGVDSEGDERPPGRVPCVGQTLGTCP